MKILQLILVATLLGSCSIGKQGVFYNEMESPPKLTITDSTIKVEPRNSIKNSALLIYALKTEVDKEKKELYMYALQAANKKFETEFEIGFNTLGIENLEGWRIYWVDPDGSKHEMKT